MRAPLDTKVAIETPEHTVFQYQVAGPLRRALAYGLDLLLCYGVVAVLATIVALAALADAAGDAARGVAKAGIGLVLVVLFFVQWVYFIVWEAARGQSPGKRALGLSVVTTTGRPIGTRAAIVRNLLRAADVLPTGYLVGTAAMALSSRFQRLGDLVAGTMVISTARPKALAPVVLSPPAHPRELAKLPDANALDADERAAIELFLRRRGSLGPARELELARMIAENLGARFSVTHADPVRLLALLYDRAVNAGRDDAPPSSIGPPSWR